MLTKHNYRLTIAASMATCTPSILGILEIQWHRK